MSEKTIHVYTDGACRGNPGPGAWGVLIVNGEQREEIGGAEKETTNNRMELTAAIEALSHVQCVAQVILTTDSNYVKDGITQWIMNWKRNGWKTKNRKPVKNDDLWKRLDDLVASHKVQWEWVKGHSGHLGNERADQIANEFLDQLLTTKD